jgi:uncharacterized membrane protein YfbV (UPF0208 family)
MRSVIVTLLLWQIFPVQKNITIIFFEERVLRCKEFLLRSFSTVIARQQNHCSQIPLKRRDVAQS